MRFAFSIAGWIVSAALTSLACLGALSIVMSSDPSSRVAQGMAYTVAGLITLAVATHPFIHNGRSALATTGGVVAGIFVAMGFFALSYLELTGYRP